MKVSQARRCTVCAHPERGRIDYLLCVAEGNHGSGRRALGEKYGLSQHAIWRHGKAHITEEYRRAARVGPFQSEEELRRLVAESGASALDRFNALYNGHLSRWLHALEIGDDDAMTRHGTLMGQLLAKVGQITRELTPPSAHQLVQQNFVMTADYYLFQRRALAVLRRHPEALQDWLNEFRQEPAHKLLIEAAPGDA
jgi:hypothetical protein